MSGEWWTEPYKGGPMVKVPGFPRPLYPPDASAHGHKPSVDGSDARAYKRVAWRLGRWPGPASAFDDSYSNAIAHGKAGGNVGDSGIAGVQRQGNVDDTGWIGKATFNLLRSARIPSGIPNAGQMAMDATAAKLIAEAWDRFGGSEPAPPKPPPASSGRNGLAAHFKPRNGYTEDPPSSNCDNRSDGIRTAQDKTAGGGTWLRYQPWCGCWCYYALDSVGVKGLDSSMASVASIEDYARAGRAPYRSWTTDRSKVKLGDLVVIGGRGVHVETVRGFSGSSTLTWGGNTSPGSSGSQSNGGGAFERTRSPSEVYGYALVR